MSAGPFEAIVCITRGGLVPAAIVARELNVRMIETVSVLSYRDYKNQGEITVLKGIAPEVKDLQAKGKGVLIVDDLVDTGKTARVVRDMLPKAHFATVYAKPMGRPLVDTFITEVSQDTWIYFPWDTGLAFQPPIREGGTRDALAAGLKVLSQIRCIDSAGSGVNGMLTRRHLLAGAAALAAGVPGAGAQSNLCEPADPDSRRLRGRRRRRYRGAAAAGADEGGTRPADHHREPHGCERDARNRRGREGAARRLHAADGGLGRGRDQSFPLQGEDGLRPGEGAGADRA